MRPSRRGQHDELVAAEPRDGVVFVKAVAHGGRHVLNETIAEHVTVVIVDLLEVVEIEKQDADRYAGRRARDRRADLVLDRIAVRQAVSESVFASSVRRSCARRSSVMSVPEQMRNCSSMPLPLCTNLLRKRKRRSPRTVRTRRSTSYDTPRLKKPEMFWLDAAPASDDMKSAQTLRPITSSSFMPVNSSARRLKRWMRPLRSTITTTD